MAEPIDDWAAVAAELADRLDLPQVPAVRSRWVGATSTVLRWGDSLAVKIPHENRVAVESCIRHVAVSRAAERLGVAAPPILLVLDQGDLGLTVPVIVSTWAPGRRLAPGDIDPVVWSRVGEQLAILHGARADQVPAGLRRVTPGPAYDPAAMVDRLVVAGRLDPPSARRLTALRDRLDETIPPGVEPVLCHGDIHAENVIAARGRFAALIDFAGAGWLDPAWDFAAIPTDAARAAVSGYRSAGRTDDTLLARAGWCRLQLALDRRTRQDDSTGFDVDALVSGVQSLLS